MNSTNREILHRIILSLRALASLRLLRAMYLGSPLQPEFEDVIMTSALYHFITGVVLHVVQFVRHEQILGGHLVAANQQSLQHEEKRMRRERGEKATVSLVVRFFQFSFSFYPPPPAQFILWITMSVSSRIRESF